MLFLVRISRLTRTRAGRRTVYTIHPDRPFRHPAQDGYRIGPFLELLAGPGDRVGDAARTRPRPAGGNTGCGTPRNPPLAPDGTALHLRG